MQTEGQKADQGRRTVESEQPLRNRVLAKAVERANERLEATGAVPLPEGLTRHKLRHTSASLLVALARVRQ